MPSWGVVTQESFMGYISFVSGPAYRPPWLASVICIGSPADLCSTAGARRFRSRRAEVAAPGC